MSQAFDYLIDTASFPDTSFEDYEITFDRVFRKAAQVELLYAAVPKCIPQFATNSVTITENGSAIPAVDMAPLWNTSYVSGSTLATALTAIITGTVTWEPGLGKLKFSYTGTGNLVVTPHTMGARMALGISTSLTNATTTDTLSPNIVDLTYPRYLKLNLEFQNTSLNGVAFPPVYAFGGTVPTRGLQKATFEIDMADSNYAELSQWYRNTRYDQRTARLNAHPDFNKIRVRWGYPDGSWVEDGAFQGVSHQIRIRVHAYTNPS